jgi:tetratricopeptide (TPR) repeat protein
MRNCYFLCIAVLIFVSCSTTNQTNQINENADIYYQRALKCLDKEKFSDAITEIDKAISINDTESEYFRIKGYSLLFLQRIDDAIENYNKAIELSLDNTDAYYGLGICYVYKQNIEEAILNWKKCIEIDPEYLEAFYKLAMAHQELNDNPSALKYYTRCIEIKPGEALFYFERGRLQINMNYVLGLQDLTKAIELEPDYAEAYWMRGFIYRMFFQDDEKAMADYNLAVKITPPFREMTKPGW